LAEAYQVQTLVAGLRESRGETIAGYKVGCIGEAVQKQLGIREPVFGRLFAGETHRSGLSLDAAAFDGLAIEGEFAFRLAKDFPPDDLSQAIGAGFAVIELHNHVFRGPAGKRAEELIANNALQAGVVLPLDEPRSVLPDALVAETISVIRNGTVLGTAKGSDLPGGPLASLVWLAARLKDSGQTLRRGQIVLTGSPLPLYAVAPGDRVEVRCSRLPSVMMTLAENPGKAQSGAN
jgi:2-keto-4-pentenoate hydratase